MSRENMITSRIPERSSSAAEGTKAGRTSNSSRERTPFGVVDQNVGKKTVRSASKRRHAATSFEGALSRMRCFETIDTPLHELNCSLASPDVSVDLHHYKQGLHQHWHANFDVPFYQTFDEVHRILGKLQVRNHNVGFYFHKHKHLNSLMRGTLVEWMIDVNHGCYHSPESLFVAVNYLDRYLSAKSVGVNQLQLLGTACLYISCKLHDVDVFHIDQFSYLAENMYQVEEIIEFEKNILVLLDFNLIAPTVIYFAELYVVYFKDIFVSSQSIRFLQALAEFLLTDYEIMNGFYPSVIAAASVLYVTAQMGVRLRSEDFGNFTVDFATIDACRLSISNSMNHIDDCQFTNARQRLLTLSFPRTDS